MSRILNPNSKQHKQQFVLLNSCLLYNYREPHTLRQLKKKTPTHRHKKSTHTYTHKNKRKKAHTNKKIKKIMKIIMKKTLRKNHNTNKCVSNNFKINRNLICTYKSAMFSTKHASNSFFTVIGGAVMKNLTSFYRYPQ